jgi:ATP-dependent Clp protease ATP-binding subunit ClpC
MDAETLVNSNKKDTKDARFPCIKAYTRLLFKPRRPTVGREREIRSIRANLARNEISNVILVGSAGVGKTAIVEQLAKEDTSSLYFEVDLSRMGRGVNGANNLAANLKELMDEVQTFQKAFGKNVVLLMDEFHQIVKLSSAAIEAIKPILARSGEYHIHIIAATTFEEFAEYIQPNEPLVERLQRITIYEPGRDVVIKALRSYHDVYVPDVPVSPRLYEDIYDYATKYMPAESQPRKSLFLFDAMIGWHRVFDIDLDRDLLDKVMYDKTGIRADWHANVDMIEQSLKAGVFNQDQAINQVVNRLHISMANLGYDHKPQGSFLFAGPTGVGKTELSRRLARLLFGDERSMLRYDMSEYMTTESAELFKNKLADDIRARPFTVVLLDEIEKAVPAIRMLFLQILDDARLTDRNGRQVNFNNCYIIFTTNTASELFSNMQEYGDDVNTYDRILRKHMIDEKFAPELLNRLDAVVPFNPLTMEGYRRIARLRLRELRDLVKARTGVQLHFNKNVVTYLTEENFQIETNAGGGREIARRIDLEIRIPVARLCNEDSTIDNIAVRAVGKSMANDKHRLKSSAHLDVRRAIFK